MPDTINVHAFRTTPDGDEYADWDELDPTLKWTVYRRTETPDDLQQPFDIPDEVDFEAADEALFFANFYGAWLGLQVHTY